MRSSLNVSTRAEDEHIHKGRGLCTSPELQMSNPSNQLSMEKDNKATLFDYLAPSGFTNLKMGAPGLSQLKRCTEVLSEATAHRMVRT